MINMGAPRILLMCEFEKGELAGGESVLFGFVEGLVAQAGNQIRIIVLTSRSMQAALHELLPPPNKVVARPGLLISPAARLKRKLRKSMPGVVAVIRKALRMSDQGMPKEVAVIDDFSLGLEPDIIHWFYPLHYAISDIPDICTVHDLNYEHLSDGFGEAYVTWRRKLMNEQVTRSQALVAISRFVADDVAARYPEAHEKIRTVKWAPFIRPENRIGASSFAQASALGDFIALPGGDLQAQKSRPARSGSSHRQRTADNTAEIGLDGAIDAGLAEHGTALRVRNRRGKAFAPRIRGQVRIDRTVRCLPSGCI